MCKENGFPSFPLRHVGAMVHSHSGQTQKPNATSGFRRLGLCRSLKRKPARPENVIKIALEEKITSWEFLRMSITKLPGHMRNTKLAFSANVSTLGLQAKIFENLSFRYAKVFAGTPHAPHL